MQNLNTPEFNDNLENHESINQFVNPGSKPAVKKVQNLNIPEFTENYEPINQFVNPRSKSAAIDIQSFNLLDMGQKMNYLLCKLLKII